MRADDPEDEDTDPREVRRIARELAATIDTTSIRIGSEDGEDEDVFRLGQFMEEARRAGVGNAAPVATTKPKKTRRR